MTEPVADVGLEIPEAGYSVTKITITLSPKDDAEEITISKLVVKACLKPSKNLCHY